MKKLLSLLLVLSVLAVCIVSASAEDVAQTAESEIHKSGDYSYIILEDGTAQITHYSSERINDLIIPAELDGVKVTAIGDNAFFGCDSLISLTIPDNITTIGDNAFAMCSSLTSVRIPSGVINIGANPFAACDKLTEIIVSPDHLFLTTIDGVLFDRLDRRLICYPCAFTAETYTVPGGTGIIGEEAFFGCSSLTSVTIPEGVTTIELFAFYECRSLTSVTIPDGVTVIRPAAFYNCSSLASVTFPDSLTTIGVGAFMGCSSLTSVTIPDSVTDIYSNPFPDCKRLSSINISRNHPVLASVDGVLFNKPDNRLICYPCGLTAESYTVPDGTKIIDYMAFFRNQNLTSVTIPDSVTSIGENAFSIMNENDEYVPNPFLTVTVSRDSYAEQYCKDKGFNYTCSDAID